MDNHEKHLKLHSAFINAAQYTYQQAMKSIMKQLEFDLYGWNQVTIKKWYGSDTRFIVKYDKTNTTLINWYK